MTGGDKMKLHLRLDVLIPLAVVIVMIAVFTGIWLALLGLVPLAVAGVVLWQMDNRMLDQRARENVMYGDGEKTALDYARKHVTSPGAHALLDEVERGRARREQD